MMCIGVSKRRHIFDCKPAKGFKNCYFALSLLLCLMLTGCNSYKVSFNERTIYMPSALLKEIPITDDALRNCIKQTIVDQQIKQVDELRELNCSNAGIQSLMGLEQFSALSQLNLSNNTIADIAPLSLLSKLTYLNLNNHQITNVTALKALVKLKHLELLRNPRLVCASAQALTATINKNAASTGSHAPSKELLLPSTCYDG